MTHIYKWLTLGTGSLITVGVSLACSYWFFYSLAGSHGQAAILAGIAGCAIQLFGYGFASNGISMNIGLRMILCAVPLLLSMFSSYSSLYGYISKKSEHAKATEVKENVIIGMLEQSMVDREISQSAAKQGVGDGYRTQAKGFLEMNSKTREKDEKLLSELDKNIEDKSSATPLDGLVAITGNSEITIIVFCAWLALMFDLLPVIAIAKLSSPTRKGEEFCEPLLKSGIGDDSVVTSVPNDTASDSSNFEINVTPAMHKGEPSVECRDVPTNRELNEAKSVVDFNDAMIHDVIAKFRSGDLVPKYADVLDYTGWKRHKAQKFFAYCVETGVLFKDGRKFIVGNNVKAFPTCTRSAN